MKKILNYSLAIIVFLSALLSGCSSAGPKKGNTTVTSKTGNTTVTTKAGNTSTAKPATPRGATGTVTTAAPVSAASGNIAASGGTLTVTASGTPITGLTVTVPANAYSAAKQFSISYAPVQSHTFGDLFKPATPLISINNGGEMSTTYMQVKIPVKVPDGSLAMAFLYDDKTKTLEGLPTLTHDANSITVGTRHFSNIILSLINRSLLKPDIDSDFRPGIDDWQFSNQGSYIAPIGHCTGQSMTAMWYYIEQPDGKGLTLNGRYDNNGDQPATPNLWQDDSLGYRFCSVEHWDMHWDALGRALTEDYIAADDQDTYDLFRYSMQLTKQPQMTEIWNTTIGGGHAMVVYRIMNGNLYIADPNWPGNEDRRIEITNGKFKPYESGENATEIAAGNSKKYDKITYVAKTSLSDWESIGGSWADLKDKTIGNGIFPSYTIYWTDDKNQKHDLADGYVSTKKLIDINGHVDDLKAGETSSIAVYRDGKSLHWDANGNYELLPGVNKLGIEVDVDIPAKDKNGNPITKSKYVDFKYINVSYSDLAIDPVTLDGQVNKEYSFTANMKNPPANSKFTWFVDDTAVQGATPNTLKTTFKTAGKHTVTVKVLDGTGKELGTAQSTANIVNLTTSANNLAIIQKYGYMEALMMTNSLIHEYNLNNKPPDADKQTNVAFWTLYTPITWDGVKFSGTRTDTPMGVTQTETLSGTVSPDGNTLLTLTSKLQSDSAIEHKTVTIVLQNVPLSYVNGIMVNDVDLSSATVQKYVVSLDNSFTDVANGAIYFSNTFKSPVWDNNSNLSISFRKTATR